MKLTCVKVKKQKRPARIKPTNFSHYFTRLVSYGKQKCIVNLLCPETNQNEGKINLLYRNGKRKLTFGDKNVKRYN